MTGGERIGLRAAVRLAAEADVISAAPGFSCAETTLAYVMRTCGRIRCAEASLA
jgi:hypothetical protein